MGYHIDLFINPHVSHGFRCAICHDVLKDPIVLDPCEHTYCRTCVEQWRLKSNTCPTDRVAITGLKRVQRNFMTVLQELQMCCPFHPVGCTATFKLGEFADHDERCAHNPENQKECTGGCGAILCRAQVRLQTHSCVGYLKEKLTEKDELLKSKDTELTVRMNELRATLLASAQKFKQRTDGELKLEWNNQLETFRHCLKRKWDSNSNSDQAACSADPALNSRPFTATEFKCSSRQNVGPKLFQTIVRIVGEELTGHFSEHWHHIPDAEDQIEETLNEAKPPLNSVPGLCGPDTGIWNVWICLQHENFPQLTRQLAAAAKIQFRLEVRNVKILVLKRYKVS